MGELINVTVTDRVNDIAMSKLNAYAMGECRCERAVGVMEFVSSERIKP